ncbi:MAG: hypothetical protein L3J08_09530 [Flavobacteriaceae bacterium]|nr:hypothetical protein [Flavobacteriaceae bacterium]
MSFGKEAGGTAGALKGTVSNETTTTATISTDIENYFTPNSDNKPSVNSPFTLDINATNETKVTISGKVTVEGVDVQVDNVTSQNNATGAIDNNTTVTVGKGQTGLFVESGTSGTTGGVKTEQKLSTPSGNFIKLGVKLSAGNQ